MKTITPILAMHGHFAGRGFLVLLAIAAVALVVVCLPRKAETK